MVSIQTSIHWGDILVIVAYFVASIAIGIVTMIRTNRKSVSGFFLAGRSMIWWPIGMSLFASNVGPNGFVGQAGSGASSGFAVVTFEWNAVFLLMLLGWIFLPVYIACGIYTMPEYLSRRFGGRRLRLYLTVIALGTYLFVTLPSELYAGALFIQQTIGLNVYIGVAIILGMSTLFTLLGGLTTVIITDALAVIIMVVGGVVLFILGLIAVGGWEALEVRYSASMASEVYLNPNTTCGRPRPDAYNIFRGLDSDYPWFGTFGRTLLGSLWYWCANQVLVQRALSAKNISHAKAGCILAGYLKLLPFVIIVLPGMISRALYPDEIACVDPEVCSRICENSASCMDIAYPKLVAELLPPAVKGLVIATMLAASTSSMTSIFNSASTLVAIDIWPIIRSSASDRELLVASKAFLVIIVGLAVAWMPVMQSAQGGELFRYTSAATGYLGGPTCAMFVIAVFSNRVTEKGAFWSMILAQIFGLVRFTLDLVYPAPSCGELDDRPSIVSALHPYDFTVIQISLAFVLCFLISIVTKPPPKERYIGLTYWTRFDRTYAAQRDEEIRQKYIEIQRVQHIKMEERKAKAIKEGKNGTRAANISDIIQNGDVSMNDLQVKAQPTSDESNNLTPSDTSSTPSLPSETQKLSPSSENQTKDEEQEEEKLPFEVPEFETHEQRMKFLEESRTQRILINVNGLLVCAFTIFLYGFFH